ncbi:MAG: hypothetical protein ABI120_13755, partial [Gemmatimonadaceae bacterium]
RTEQIRAHLATCTGCDEHMQFCRTFLQRIEWPTVPTAAVAVLRDRVRDALRRDGLTIAD